MPFDMSLLDSLGAVLIDDRDPRGGSNRTFVFTNPSKIITASTATQVDSALQELDQAIASGLFAAGYVAYEAGLVLDKLIEPRHPLHHPLIWLGVYEGCQEFDSQTLDIGDTGHVDDIQHFSLNISDEEYLDCVHQIQKHIAAGDTYQVNYTCKLVFDHYAPARHLFARLRKAHPVGYSAFINTGECEIMSFSPELFLRRTGNRLLTRPMKGTTRRGRYCEEDERIARTLALDQKNRAENIMIVDLMRNDLGRVSEFGQVLVPEVFHVERYASVFQMTSDVEGTLRQGTTTSDIIRATFPPGSITGAPKIRSMEIINELEHEPRGVYCGCIGMFHPGGDFMLNVAIRTVLQRNGRCELGLGSGIVTDSDPNAELEETLLKGSFVTASRPDFELLETILYTRGTGYAYLNDHIQRLERSALYFDRPFSRSSAEEALDRAAVDIESASGILSEDKARVRLIVSECGACRVEWSDAGGAVTNHVKLLLASRMKNPDDAFLYHKTTHRLAYDQDLQAARKAGYFDVLYTNLRGELTECSITNLALEIDGEWMTPSLDCGLLPGIWRKNLLAARLATQRILTFADLARATRVVIGNSVRGAIEVMRVENDRQEAIWPKDPPN